MNENSYTVILPDARHVSTLLDAIEERRKSVTAAFPISSQPEALFEELIRLAALRRILLATPANSDELTAVLAGKS